MQLNVKIWLIYIMADDWIRTVDLGCPKRPLCQMAHNLVARDSSFGVIPIVFHSNNVIFSFGLVLSATSPA